MSEERWESVLFELDEASGIVLAFKYNNVNIYTSVYTVYLFF